MMATVDILDLLADQLAPRSDDSRETRHELRLLILRLADGLVDVAGTVPVGSERWADLRTLAMGLVTVVKQEGGTYDPR